MKVKELYLSVSKGQHVRKDELFLTESGIEGDYHKGLDDSQISIISGYVSEWMKHEHEEICFLKFKPQIMTEGLNTENLNTGDLLRINDAVLEITDRRKRCHPEICSRISEGRDCLLKKAVRYAKVIKGGTIRVMDRIIQDTPKEKNLEQALK